MQIKEFVSQNRRDFRAIYKCEFCTSEKEGYGYDDNYFHLKVIPEMKCNDCGKSSVNDGGIINPYCPKYPDSYQI